MSGLSTAHSVALAALLARCSEAMLKSVSTTVSGLPGEKANDLRRMLAEEMTDRRRRAVAFAPILPMFAERADGIPATTFPPDVLARLWKAASGREPQLLPRLDEDEGGEIIVANRICQAAASIVRDRPDLVWPEASRPDIRDKGLEDLVISLDLAHLARRALPLIDVWLKRPDGDQLAELRLMVKDGSGIHADGAWRLVEILFAHLADAVLVLRILTRTSGAADRIGFLSVSEMGEFVERLLNGVSQRVERLTAWATAGGKDDIAPVMADLDWCANVLAELDVTLTLEPDSPWGMSVRESRLAVAAWMTTLYRKADKAVDAALPMTRVQTSGRMTRQVPDLSAPARGEAAETAFALMKLVGVTRGAASTFGAEAGRKALMDELVERLTSYADQILGVINDEATDRNHALALIAVAARYLELIEAKEAAKTVRRRAAVAGGSAVTAGASSAAA
ncbi:hypothetical protein GCM10009422_11430 [Brevundimonas kwangchunensis]|uniref:Uncharacterized protein n=2 Tax=Brevundimonas kwangchunensis TaxID=322163 RepID=A0ABN1GS32_9CAUL